MCHQEACMENENYEWHDEDDVDLAGDPPQDCEMSVESGTLARLL